MKKHYKCDKQYNFNDENLDKVYLQSKNGIFYSLEYIFKLIEHLEINN